MENKSYSLFCYHTFISPFQIASIHILQTGYNIWQDLATSTIK